MEPNVSTSQDNVFVSKISSKNNKILNKNEKREIMKESANIDKDKELRIDDIEKMREKLESLNPQKIIEDILKKSKKKEINSSPQEKKLSKDDYLTNLKNNAMNNFIESERNKSLQEIRNNFDEKLKEFQKATELYAEKKHKENLEYLNQLTACKNKNLELDTTIHHLNQESKLQKEQLKQYENNIFKLQSKFDVFERLKPIFEEFFKEFPDQNPISVIQEIKDKREASTKMINDINDLTRIKHQLENEKNEITFAYEKKIIQLEQKLKILETTNKENADQYDVEMKQLKSELKVYEEYKKENLKMSNMLFQIYNKLIERLKLNRDININENLLVTEKDFEPNLFDNKEIMTYIDKMLVTSSEGLSSKMLRETIAYANMMLRTYLKDKLKNKFNPVETFKEIKNFIDNLTLQLNDSENKCKELQGEVKKFDHKIKKLENEIKYKQIQFEGLKKKYDLQINERIQKSRELRNEMIKNKENRRNKIHNLKNLQNLNQNNKSFENYESESEDASFTGNASVSVSRNNYTELKTKFRTNSAFPGKSIKEDKNEIFLTENNENEIRGRSGKKSKSRMKSGKSELTTRPNTAFKNLNKPKTALIGYYLTHNKFFKKDSESKAINPNETDFQASSSKNFSATTKNVFSDRNKISDFNENLISGHKLEENEKMRNYDSEKYSMRFKDMIIAKNNDKLVKTGCFGVLPSHSDALRNLVDQTNKLFLYKQKVIPKNDSKNIFNKFQKNIDRKFKILKGIKPEYKAGHYEMGENIVSDINTMIKNLEKKD